jgi:hypothetical protein
MQRWRGDVHDDTDGLIMDHNDFGADDKVTQYMDCEHWAGTNKNISNEHVQHKLSTNINHINWDWA